MQYERNVDDKKKHKILFFHFFHFSFRQTNFSLQVVSQLRVYVNRNALSNFQHSFFFSKKKLEFTALNIFLLK